MAFVIRSGLALFAVFALSGCQTNDFDAEKYAELNQRYDVVIRRDVRGVPHILGATDPDTAFGFAYAQAEDNWQLIEDAMPFIVATVRCIRVWTVR